MPEQEINPPAPLDLSVFGLAGMGEIE